MREAGAKSGQLFVRRVVYGFMQALKTINVILNRRGVSMLPRACLSGRTMNREAGLQEPSKNWKSLYELVQSQPAHR